ncbi:MAG TPA: hypothetical protein VKD91_09825 [Pyrinomonadaceae bacterium]|nr:hypothetical protein [Pyrinomonadaceae bacterium]
MLRIKLKFTTLALCVLATAVVVRVHTTHAQSPSPGPSPAANARPTPANFSSPSPAAHPKVVGVEGNLELDDIIRVEVDHLNEWAEKNDASKLVPYLNGLAIHGNYPLEIHASQNHLQFHLQNTLENRHVWIDLLGEPHSTRKAVAFSVGLDNQSPFDSAYDLQHPIWLTVINPPYGVIALVVVVVTLFVLVLLSVKTNLVRDGGESPVPGKLRPYNLGRVQMAFWFFLIYASYVTIWLITDALDTITASLLALMGISAGTALSEALIDSGKMSANTDKLVSLTAERQSLEQSVPDIQAQINSINANPNLLPEDISSRDSLNKQLQDNRTRLAQVTQEVQTLTPAPGAGVSKGFLRDILSDGGGYSFHRYQICAWTIVLGIIFVSSVYNDLSMPEFSATLLGLMGISSGTYIGFKFPETK